MNLTSPEFFKNAPSRGARVSRLLCATLCILFFTAVPALAEPVTINQVVQTLSISQGALNLELNTLVAQDPGPGRPSESSAPAEPASAPSAGSSSSQQRPYVVWSSSPGAGGRRDE